MTTKPISWACFFLLVAASGCASHAPQGVPNFACVEPDIWRGGQPTNEGWRYLKNIGVCRTIKLNASEEGSDLEAEKLGIVVVNCPISPIQATIGKPDAQAMRVALRSMVPGTYVHCSHGQDRTGLFIGLYRVEVEHWSKSQARAEMAAHGFHPICRGLCWSWEEDVRER
jgi:hypothetical protein